MWPASPTKVGVNSRRSLLLAEGGQGIDAGGAAGWDVAGD